MADSLSDEVKAERLQILLDRQRELQRVSYARHVGQVLEVMVEGHNRQRNQVIGRTSQNKTLNFTTTQPILPALGSYQQVLVTQAFPNSLVGEKVEVGRPLAWRAAWRCSTMSEPLASTAADIEVQIRGLMLDPVTNMPIVVLKDVAVNWFCRSGLEFLRRMRSRSSSKRPPRQGP